MGPLGIITWLTEEVRFMFEADSGYNHVITSIFISVFLIILSFLAWRKLRSPEENIIPQKEFSLVSFFEVTVEAILRLMEDVIGKNAKDYFPLIGTLFIYILVCDLVGVIPGLTPPTSNINTNIACSLCVFVYYNYLGIKKHGLLKYLKHLAGPIIWIAPLIFTIEIISHIVRPLSLSVRLFGNMAGDHIVLGIFSSITPFLIPIIFMALAIFISFIQAFVFCLLSVVYISLAIEKEEH